MKGIVFTEFLAMVEEKFGYETVDRIIEQSELPNDGAYTSVGTYNHEELVKMIVALHHESGIPIPDLIKTYGIYFFDVLEKNYGIFFNRVPNLFAFLESIHGYIHVEVKKLYPDAELPAFVIKEKGDNRMVMVYESERKLSDFAEGLLEKAALHYKEEIKIDKRLLTEDGKRVEFTITKQ